VSCVIDERQAMFSTRLQIDRSTRTHDVIKMRIDAERSSVQYHPRFWQHKLEMWKDTSMVADGFQSHVLYSGSQTLVVRKCKKEQIEACI
jgi:hypothetical protein